MDRSGAASATALKITSITRRMVSVYPPTGRGQAASSSDPSPMTISTGARQPELAGTSAKRCLRAT